MCPSRVIRFTLLVIALSLLPVGIARGDVRKVSLILADVQSRAAVEAVRILHEEHPELRGKVSVHLFFRQGLGKQNLSPVRQSRLVFIFIMGREIFDAVSPDLEAAAGNGARIYGFGGTLEDDHRKMGIVTDEKVTEYYRAGGRRNLAAMILYALKKDLGLDVSYDEPEKSPLFGIYEHRTGKVFPDVDAYKKNCPSCRKGRPWVGVVFNRSSLEYGQSKPLDALLERLEGKGFNVLPVYGFPSAAAVERFFFDSGGKRRISVLVTLGMKVGVNPGTAGPLFTRLNVPVLNAVTLHSQSREAWEKSPVGLDIFERAWQIGNPEMTGVIQPTVIASQERMTDPETGMAYVEERPVPERIDRLVERIRAWTNLREKPNREKRIALIYYNYPPGKQNIGASCLNVLPGSLWEIAKRLKAEGYDLGNQEIDADTLFHDVHRFGRNIGNWARGELDRLVRTGRPVLIPVEIYRRWFEELPEKLKTSVIKSWGPPESCNIMTWTGAGGAKYIVIPAVGYGNLLLAPQPSRGWEQDPKKIYHDVALPPHHQYLAFYLWLKKGFQADAVAHMGTHGTLEWLSGKEVGFSAQDPPEALIRDLPNVYPYIVDNVGEGTQAKRRGMAVIIDHMTPPFDKAGLNKELRDLASLISDYAAAKEKSPLLAGTKIEEINRLAKKTGLLTDLNLKEVRTEEEAETLEHYIKEIAEKQTPFGLHTFGKAPEEKYRRATAEAVVSIEKNLTGEERQKRIAGIEARIVQGARRELDSFMAALSGRYVPAGRGNDPIRNPDSLPTGKNFYSFDPTRVPAKATYETGVKLAGDLLAGYRQRHGVCPDKLTFNLWAVETMRNEGVMESQIMHLLGVRPKWDERGRVIGVEAVSRGELGRARIDVTVVPSGLYRDLFPNLMDLLDKAVSLAKRQDEKDNILRSNILRTKAMLMQKGIAGDRAERLASVRIFTEPPGAYGTNLDKAVVLSNTWDRERQVADVYFMRMSHLYGQGFRGDKIEGEPSASGVREDISLTLLKNALSGSKMAVHCRSSNVFATLDNDDVFQYLGGTAMAIRAVDGKTPEVYVTNLSNPTMPRQETLEKVMGREMRSRYLNPQWIKAMMTEGYAGARLIDKVVEHLWGWQVTVPEAVDAAKWNEMYETYVLDRNGLNVKEMFRQAGNPWAYQSLVARMLETVRKSYWKPDRKVVETLAGEYAESALEAGLACCDHTCNNPLLSKYTAGVLLSVPGLAERAKGFMKALDRVRTPDAGGQKSDLKAKGGDGRKTAPGGKAGFVEGYEMQDLNGGGASSAPIPYLFLGGFLFFVGLLAWGWRRSARRSR